MDGTIADTDALETALETSGAFALTLDGAFADGDAFLVLFDNGVDSFLATVEMDDVSDPGGFVADELFATGDLTAIVIATFEGVVDAKTILTSDVALIA